MTTNLASLTLRAGPRYEAWRGRLLDLPPLTQEQLDDLGLAGFDGSICPACGYREQTTSGLCSECDRTRHYAR